MTLSPGIRLVGLFVVTMSAALAAQTAQQRPTFRSGVDLIEVDVTVVDGDSYPITDLQASDFSVTVDGEPRRVVQAQFVSLRPPEEAEMAFPPAAEEIFSSSNTDQTPGRLVVIAVDEASILFGEGRHVMRAAGEFVDSLSPADRVGLVAIPHGVYIDFTSDHDRVRRAVEGLSGLGVHRRPELRRIGLGEAYRITVFNDRGTEEIVARRLCGSGGTALCRNRLHQNSREIVLETRYDSGNARRGLESLLGEMRELEGPNTLVWISGGFIIDDQLALLEIKKRAAASRTTLYVMMVPEPLIDMSQRASYVTARDDRRKREEGLLALAAFTGARLMRAQFNPGPLFERIERELSGYYLLGVESRPTDRDKERRGIKVSVARDGVRVRARREISFTAEDVDQSVDERLARLLRSPMATQELPLKVATYTYQGTEPEQMRVLVAAEVDVPAGLSSELTLGVMLRDAEGTTVLTRQQQITATPADTPHGPVLKTSFPLSVSPGTYSLRVAVIDATGQRGSVDHPVHARVTSSGPLAVGDLVVADQASLRPGGVRPPVDARVSGDRLVVYTELYADAPAVWERTTVHIGVADTAKGPARTRTTVTFDGLAARGESRSYEGSTQSIRRTTLMRMAMGTRETDQPPLWIATSDLPTSPGHPFYARLTTLLDGHHFDRFVEGLCDRFYAPVMGRPSLAPGRYFRLLLVGYFEGIDSERGMAWRATDSLAVRSFLRLAVDEAPPDHSTIARTRRLIDLETHRTVFTWVQQRLVEAGRLKGKTIAIDATTLEANAAMRSIVRRDTGESYQAFLAGLAKASGIETPTREGLARLDRKRKKKKTSNTDWTNPHDPDAKVTKMKDGRTHLAHKAEHAVDMETGAIVAVTLQGADVGDTTTIIETAIAAAEQVEDAQANVDDRQSLEEIVGDKGYHSNQTLIDLDAVGIRSYVSEPDRGRRDWSKDPEARAPVYGNRRRMRGRRGRRLMRQRGERIERSFAHLYDTGGMRRTHLRGHTNILKRLLIHAGGFNLGLVMRHLIGIGTPRGLQGRVAAVLATLGVLMGVVRRRLTTISSSHRLIPAVRGRLASLATFAVNSSAAITCTTGC